MMPRAALGLAAILALTGIIDVLPPYIAFFVGGLAIVLFPGIIAVDLIAPSAIERRTFPEKLIMWFVVGTGVLAVLGFTGILVQARLNHLILAAGVGYAFLTTLVLARKMPRRGLPSPGSSSEPRPRRAINFVLLGIAVGAALLTLLSQRDSDDWYYLAYIRDFVANHHIGSEDAIFGMGGPASPRLWYGGAWWLVEALLVKATRTDPIVCHQIYLPLLILPLAVFAVFTLSKQIFKSDKTALLACILQVFFYISSAFPYKSGGWMLFCRAAQDKTVACFVIVPLAAALGVGFVRHGSEESGVRRESYLLFWIALLTSFLVHPLGPVWCAFFILPLTLVEMLRKRTLRSVRVLVMIIVPFLVCGSILAFGRGLVTENLEAEQSTPRQATAIVSSFYFPGEEVSSFTWVDPPLETSSPITWMFSERFQAANPLYVSRYPLAIAGLILCFLLIARFRSSLAARFLVCLTFSVLFFAFTPIGAVLSASLLTWRIVYRLSWIFPWGLVIAFWLSTINLSFRWILLIVFAVAIGLGRGDLRNYAEALAVRKEINRPSTDLVHAFRFLSFEPSPQGVVLGSDEIHKKVAAFLPDAYPANYRGTGTIDDQSLDQLLRRRRLDDFGIREIKQRPIRYILLRTSMPLAKALARRPSLFPSIYQNDTYGLWKVPSDVSRGPLHQPEFSLILLTLNSLRPDHLGCYGYTEQTSPRIDRLARNSMIFENVVCQSSMTLPSHVSMFTGMNPRHHKAISNGSRADSAHTMLAEVLSSQGYLTAAFVTSRALDSKYGLDQGFDVYWEIRKGRLPRESLASYERGEDPTTDAALAWLKEHTDSAFFVWINWDHPQVPYSPLARYSSMFAGDYKGMVTGEREFIRSVWEDRIDLSEEDLKYLLGLYDGEIAFADAQVGRVLDKLDCLDLLENTMVFVTADHGEGLYEHEYFFGHDMALYDECIMVPLIVYAPTLEGGRSRISELVQSIDIFPTVLDLLEVEYPSEPLEGGHSVHLAQLQPSGAALEPNRSAGFLDSKSHRGIEGKSLLDLIEGGEGATTDYAFSETFPFPDKAPPRHAARTSRFKLIWKETRSGSIIKEFYDLRADPGETLNLYLQNPEMATRLDSVLAAWTEDGGLHPAPIPSGTRVRQRRNRQDSQTP